MLLNVSGVNYNLNSNYTKYLAQLCGRFFYVLENFHSKFANLVAPPTDITTKRLVPCKAHLVLYSRRKQRPNRCIIGDGILPQSGKCGSEFGTRCGAIRRRRKNCNMGAQLQSPSGAHKPQKYFGKFTSCRTFGAHKLTDTDTGLLVCSQKAKIQNKLVRSESLLDYMYKV